MTQYGTYTETGSIIRASDGACIPADPANRDYQAAMAAVEAGDTIAPYVEPAPTAAELAELDQTTLNTALIAEGSVVRALGLVMFAEINKLRVKNGDTAYTLAQFKTALLAQMR